MSFILTDCFVFFVEFATLVNLLVDSTPGSVDIFVLLLLTGAGFVVIAVRDSFSDEESFSEEDSDEPTPRLLFFKRLSRAWR
jgi:hypothetical protein